MCTNIIQAQPSWESHPSFERVSGLETLMTTQCPNAFFNLVGEFAHSDARVRDRLHVLTDLTMNFGSLAVVGQELIIHILDSILMTEFCRSGSLEVLVENRVLDDLTLRVLVAVEDIGKCDPGWCSLLPLFLLVVLFLLLGLAFSNQNQIAVLRVGLAYCSRRSGYIQGRFPFCHLRRLHPGLRAHQIQVRLRLLALED